MTPSELIAQVALLHPPCQESGSHHPMTPRLLAEQMEKA